MHFRFSQEVRGQKPTVFVTSQSGGALVDLETRQGRWFDVCESGGSLGGAVSWQEGENFIATLIFDVSWMRFQFKISQIRDG